MIKNPSLSIDAQLSNNKVESLLMVVVGTIANNLTTFSLSLNK